MRAIIVHQKERVGKWTSEKLGQAADWHDYEAMGVEKDGVLIAGVVFGDYVENTRCSIHCAGEGKKWLSREFLFVVFDYAFRQLKCKVVVNPVNSENTSSVKFTSHLGFEEKCRIKGGSPAGDLIVFAMHRDKCRWLKRKTKELQHG